MGEMTNAQALKALSDFTDTCHRAIDAAVWAQAFLTAGGEPTWDAVKSVVACAEHVAVDAKPVAELAARYEEVLP